MRKKLIDLYNEEFRTSLIAQATDRSGRYKLGSASQLKVGDIVLMREDNMKRADFPMARIVELHYNFLDEVNEVVLIKGASRELVKRHPVALIPLLSVEGESSDSQIIAHKNGHLKNHEGFERKNLARTAKSKGIDETRSMLLQGLA